MKEETCDKLAVGFIVSMVLLIVILLLSGAYHG